MQSKVSMCCFVVVIMFSSFHLAQYWQWKELKKLGEGSSKKARSNQPNLKLVSRNLTAPTETAGMDKPINKNFTKRD